MRGKSNDDDDDDDDRRFLPGTLCDTNFIFYLINCVISIPKVALGFREWRIDSASGATIPRYSEENTAFSVYQNDREMTIPRVARRFRGALWDKRLACLRHVVRPPRTPTSGPDQNRSRSRSCCCCSCGPVEEPLLPSPLTLRPPFPLLIRTSAGQRLSARSPRRS